MPKTQAQKSAEAEQTQQAKDRLAASKARREKRKRDADFDFWADVAAAIDSRELNQTEVCDATGYKREHVRRQLIEHRAEAKARAAEATD